MARNCGLDTKDLLMAVSYGKSDEYRTPIYTCWSMFKDKSSRPNCFCLAPIGSRVAVVYKIWKLCSSLPSRFTDTGWANLETDAQMFSGLVKTERCIQGNDLEH